MNRYYAIQVRADGLYEIYVTTNGIDRVPLPAVFDSPRKAIAYADMRQADIQPLRSPDEVAARTAVIPPRRESEAAHPAS